MKYPERIVCLTTEPTEVLYLLGEQKRIVGISGYTTHPPEARKEKPKISAFTTANIEKILALEPDLVIGFSNLQADIAASLIKSGVEVHIFNQRTIQQVLNMIGTVGQLVGQPEKSSALIRDLKEIIKEVRLKALSYELKPKIYFEEWDEPMITGIEWVSELVEIAGGKVCFKNLSTLKNAKDRVINPLQVIEEQPDIIIGSWCGKKFQPNKVSSRTGWEVIPAIRDGFIREIKSADILQPGPRLIASGLICLQSIIDDWVEFKKTDIN